VAAVDGDSGTDADGGSTTEDADETGPSTTTTTIEVSTTAEASAVGLADGKLVLPADYVAADPNFDERVALSTRYALVQGGQVYLYGFVPQQEILDQLEQAVGAVVGPDNLIVETFVDPDAPFPPDSPVYVDDRVLFEFNSVDVQDQFIPILELGVTLMSQNPAVTMRVIARTDAAGSEDVNLRVAEQRAQAVVDYVANRGIDPDRMIIDARGEADASDADDDLTAAQNRSVEFRVIGLLGPPG
jgi:outer membrane protein OmpA-like peptidoglycan-associated protein